MDPVALFLIVVPCYLIVGIAVAKILYRRRHGVRIKIYGGGVDAIPALPYMLFRPVYLLVPGLRNRDLCRCPAHVMARDEARAGYERLQAAAERDEQFRRR